MTENDKQIVVSACLAGIKCNYRGEAKPNSEIVRLVKEGKAIYVCPEQIGGLPTPREEAEIEEGKTAKDVLEGNGRVLTKSGEDVTEQFVKGAQQTLEVCERLGIKTAILKARSPSCGSEQIYDGTFSGNRISGSGITAELLKQNGVNVLDEEHFSK